MAKASKKKMTEQELADWDELYCYIKKLMNYDENQCLSKNMVLRLKGLSTGKFMANKNIKDNANYSYKIILLTFKYCNPSIQRALDTVSFENENHKFNYIMRIVENNINTVYIRMKNAEKAKVEAQESDVSYAANYVNMFKAKKTNGTKKLDDLW